jgi:transcriptional regulator with XRE-family HTH domain
MKVEYNYRICNIYANVEGVQFMIISERIFKLMEEKGVTQLELAERTGIAQSTISDWKRKKTNPSADKIMSICDVLDVSPFEVLQDTIPSKGAGEIDFLIASEGTAEYDVLKKMEKLNKKTKEELKTYVKNLKNKK